MNGAEMVQAMSSGGIMYFPLEMVFAALAFSWPLKRRGRFWLRLVLSFLGCMALMMACEALFYGQFDLDAASNPIITTGSTVFWCASLFFLCVLFVWAVYEVRFREALYCGACAYLMEHLAYCARILCAQFLLEGSMEAGAWGYFIVVAGVYAAVYLLFAKRMVQDGGLSASAQESLALTLITLALETGNEILDTVLTEKSLICTRHEIALSCIADGGRLAFMDPVDLYTLVGNALDNAIEAVLPLPAAERLIRLRVQEKAGLVFLQIENPYAGALELRNGLPLTHKEDKQNHGFGLKSIRDVGEKYQGILNLKTESGLFVLRLSFPLCEQQFPTEN